MTTHYIEEAERLCDRVAIVDAGKIIAIGTPRELQDRSAGKSTIEIVCEQPLDGLQMPEWPEATQHHAQRRRKRHLTVASLAPGANSGGDCEMGGRAGARARGRSPQAPHAGRCFHRTDRQEAARMKRLSRSDQESISGWLSGRRSVIFFNYLMPLIFFFVFAQAFHAEQGGAITQVVTMVTVIGILGNGLFGAGMRAVQERENNILRRYKVAPISPAAAAGGVHRDRARCLHAVCRADAAAGEIPLWHGDAAQYRYGAALHHARAWLRCGPSG